MACIVTVALMRSLKTISSCLCCDLDLRCLKRETRSLLVSCSSCSKLFAGLKGPLHRRYKLDYLNQAEVFSSLIHRSIVTIMSRLELDQ